MRHLQHNIKKIVLDVMLNLVGLSVEVIKQF